MSVKEELDFVCVKFTKEISQVPFTSFLDSLYDGREKGCHVICDRQRIFEVKVIAIMMGHLK